MPTGNYKSFDNSFDQHSLSTGDANYWTFNLELSYKIIPIRCAVYPFLLETDCIFRFLIVKNILGFKLSKFSGL